MGGASRGERKRRQEAAAQRLAAAGIQVPEKRSNPALMIVIAVVVVAVLVGGVVLYMRNSSSGAAVAPTYTATASGAVVTAGTGKAVIDVYEDFLCPNCEIFEKAYGNEIVSALNEGKLTVRYHSHRDPRLPHHPAGLLHAGRQRGAVRRARRHLPDVPPEAVRRASRPRAARASPTRSSCSSARSSARGATSPPASRAQRTPPPSPRRPTRRSPTRPCRPTASSGPHGRGQRPRWSISTTPAGSRRSSAEPRLPPGRRHRVPLAGQGAVAQLVAHLTGSQRVRGSNPLSSTLAVTSARSELSQVKAGVELTVVDLVDDRLFTACALILEQNWSTASGARNTVNGLLQ